MKNIPIRTVDSIAEEMEQIQNRIRVRAYEEFLDRTDGSNGELEDWLAAERELICIVAASLREEDNRIIGQIEIPKPKDLEIRVTSEDALIRAEVQDESGKDTDTGSQSRSAFGVIRFSAAINPAGVRADYSRGILRLTAPLSQEGPNSFRKSA
jgi:HSP20 family molecular chaperone IbpA